MPESTKSINVNGCLFRKVQLMNDGYLSYSELRACRPEIKVANVSSDSIPNVFPLLIPISKNP
jgi:hypothetical protein